MLRALSIACHWFMSLFFFRVFLNLFFLSSNAQVYGDPELCDRTREQCMDHEVAHRDDFAQFVDEPFDDYVARLRRNGEVADHPEIQAMAELYCRPVEVYAADSGKVRIFECGTDRSAKSPASSSSTTDAEKSTAPPKLNPPIRLLYIDGNHYNSIIDVEVPSVGVGLGLPGLQAGEAGPEVQMTRRAEEESVRELEEKQLVEAMLLESKKGQEQQEKDLVEAALKESQSAREQQERELMEAALRQSEIEAAEKLLLGNAYQESLRENLPQQQQEEDVEDLLLQQAMQESLQRQEQELLEKVMRESMFK